MSIVILFLLVILFLICFTMGYGGLRAAPWMPTVQRDIKRFLKLAHIQKDQKVYDLGCGDGRIVCGAAKAGAYVVGYEVSIIHYVISRMRIVSNKLQKQSTIRFKDFWHADLSDADVVYVYLTPYIYKKLRKKLERELKPGSKVITYIWPIKEWQPIAVDAEPGLHKMFCYRM